MNDLFRAAVAGALLVVPALPVEAKMIEADFRSELDLPDFSFSFGPRVLQRLGVALPGAGFELDVSDQIANPSGWGDALQVDLDPETNLLSLTPTDTNTYQTVEILVSGIVFDAPQRIAGVSAVTIGAAVVPRAAEPVLTTSFGDDWFRISYTSDLLGDNGVFGLGEGVDLFRIELADTTPGNGPEAAVPLPGALPLAALGIAALVGAARRRA